MPVIYLCLLSQVSLSFLSFIMYMIFTEFLNFNKHAVISPILEKQTKTTQPFPSHTQNALKTKKSFTYFLISLLPFTAKLKGVVCICCLSFLFSEAHSSQAFATLSINPVLDFILLNTMVSLRFFFFFFFFETEFRSCYPGWSAMARSRFTATSASWVQAILLPQSPE